MQHILPPGFKQVRYYGLHATCKAAKVREFLKALFLKMGRMVEEIVRQVKHYSYKFIPDLSPSSVTRILKRLLLHGLIKRVARSRKYYLTKLGKTVIITGLKTRALFITPSLAGLEVAFILAVCQF